MNSRAKTSKQNRTDKTVEISEQEFLELKQDMKSTAFLGWIQQHQQQLIAAGVAMVLAIVGVSMWIQRKASMRESAAVLYQKAIDTRDDKDREALLNQVVKEYDGTAYAPFSQLMLASLDRDHAIDHLKSLLAHLGLTRELKVQATLDLARLYTKAGKKQEALDLLAGLPAVSGYEQLRHFMMGELSESKQEKTQHYQKALDAKSYDTKLKSDIEQKLKDLRSESQAGS